MSYNGNITIFNEDGDVVFDKELSTDEIIEALIASHDEVEGAEEKKEGEDKEEQRAKVRLCSFCKKPGHIARNCPNADGTPTVARKVTDMKEFGEKKRKASTPHTPGAAARLSQYVAGKYEREEPAEKPPQADNGRVLTADEFDLVKDLRSDIPMKTSLQILSELPDDVKLQQVNWAILIEEYEGYVAHANAA